MDRSQRLKTNATTLKLMGKKVCVQCLIMREGDEFPRINKGSLDDRCFLCSGKKKPPSKVLRKEVINGEIGSLLGLDSLELSLRKQYCKRNGIDFSKSLDEQLPDGFVAGPIKPPWLK